MGATKINEWLQVIGMFGVIGSLIFVGLQMKQTQAIASSSIYQARAAMAMDLQVGSMTGSEYLSGTVKIESGQVDLLTPVERIAQYHYFYASMKSFDNVHSQYENGFIPEDHWNALSSELQCMLEYPHFRGFLGQYTYRPSFQSVIDKVIERSIDKPTGCTDNQMIAN